MWSAEMHTRGVYSHGNSVGVNSIFSLLKKVASCGGKEQLRGDVGAQVLNAKPLIATQMHM